MRKRKKVKNIGQPLIIPHTDFFEDCRQKGKAKRDQRSLQAHKNRGSLSMVFPSLEIGRTFEKKTIFVAKSDEIVQSVI